MNADISRNRHGLLYRLCFLLAAVCLAAACLLHTGCVNPQFPKDAHIEKASVEVSTVWGGYKMTVEQLDTGGAARNSTSAKK